MKFSHNWLQTFFDTPLPVPAVIEEKLTFHSSEVEEVVMIEDDTVYDLKVLPDKSAWLLSSFNQASSTPSQRSSSVLNKRLLRYFCLHSRQGSSEGLSSGDFGGRWMRLTFLGSLSLSVV